MRRARQEFAALRSSFTSHHTAFTWPHPEVSCNMLQHDATCKGNPNLCLLAVAGCEVPDKGDCQSHAHFLLSLQHSTALVVTGCDRDHLFESCSNKEGDSNQFNINGSYVCCQVIAQLPPPFLFEVEYAPAWYYHTDSTQTHKRTVLLILSLK